MENVKPQHKHILIVANIAWTINNFRAMLVQKLVDCGYRVTIAVADPENILPEIRESTKSVALFVNRFSIHPKTELKSFVSVFLNVRKFRPNVILSFTIKPNILVSIAGKILNIPTVLNITGVGRVKHANGILYYIIFNLYIHAARLAQWIFFQNQDNRSFFLNMFPRIKYTSSLLPGSGVNIEHFVPVRVESPNIRFVCVSRLLHDKGIKEFIAAAHLLHRDYPNTEFTLLGEINVHDNNSIREDELRERLENSPVRYEGFHNDVRQFLVCPACFVLPSYYPEGLPKSLLEAAAMGLAIITTNTPGCREIVEVGKNGFLVEPRSVEDLHIAMKRMANLGNKGLENFGQQSRNKILEGFSEQRVVNLYIQRIQHIFSR